MNKQDLLKAIGIEPEPTPASLVLPGLAAFGGGLLVGAGLALLFAPKKGSELRGEIGDNLNQGADQLRGKLEDAKAATMGGLQKAGLVGEETPAPEVPELASISGIA